MIKGQFPDFNTYKKAEELNISQYEEYNFMLEQMDLEKQKNKKKN
jgi:hypothetical protein